MKLATAVKYGLGLGTALLSYQDGFKGVDAGWNPGDPIDGCLPWCIHCDWCGGCLCISEGDIDSNKDGTRKLEEGGASGVVGKVVIGRLDNTATELFVATNATNFPKGSLNGTLKVAIPDSEDCTTKAYGRALPFSLNNVFNELGGIGGKNGWLKESISEVQGANSTLPVSLTDLLSGVETEYGLAAYLLGSDKELLGCAHLKQVDDDTATKYYELLFGPSDDEVVKADTASSGSKKSGVFVFASASAIAAVGFAVALGEVLAL
jgi:hypothetical protein